MSSPTNPPTPATYTGSIPRIPLRFLWFVSKNHLPLAIAAVGIVIVASVLQALSPLFVKEVIELSEAGNIKEAVIFGLIYPLFVFSLQSLWRLSSVPGRKWVSRVRRDVYNELISYSFDHSHSFFINHFAGSLLSKVGNVVRSSERLILDFLWHHTDALVGMIAYSILLLTIDVYTGVIFFVLLLTIVYLNYKLVPRKQVLSKANAESETFLRGQIVDVFTNIAATRQYAQKAFEKERIGGTVFDNQQIFEESWKYSEWMRILNSLVLLLFSLLMFGLLAMRWSNGEVTTGEFVVVMVVLFSVSGTLVFIGRVFNDTATAYGEMTEGLGLLLSDREIIDVDDARALKVNNSGVVWKDVTFQFGDKFVFKNFNLTIKPGERIGLVGPSGAGKTTFVSLLLRQHEINHGEIVIDGQNIATVTQDSLREHIAVVPQEPLLFHRTIRENIAYGKPDATQGEIRAVAAKAQALDFILELPDKFDTLVGERGVKLSGGQKQRVAIARAMLKNAPILVLDEATSALDSESEVLIQKALHTLMEGKTVVAIAHRLSTLREMDRILVLENGQIVEDGTHDTLMRAGGTYQRLWEHQAGGFLQE